MLTDKVRVEHATTVLEPEDIFSSALSTIFPDDLINQHGDPDATVVYKSARFGDIRLTVADPARDDQRKLFAHYLWNAGVMLAELLSGAGGDLSCSVENGTVLELGAGVGLGGIMSCLTGANEVVISDYPNPDILKNISKNVKANVPATLASRITVQGHEWGELEDDFSSTRKGTFTTILAADCLWMPWQHQNLARSMIHFLSADLSARVIVIAGFHTGRAKMAPFFDAAAEEGLETESIVEVDVEGKRRPWATERDGGREDITGRKRWLVVAKLRRRVI